MEKEEFFKILLEKAKKIDIELNRKQIEQFYIYMNLLIEWNKKINLTAIIEPTEIILKHFIDSLTIAKYIKNKERLVDVGTGAGFPGIPLKILNDSLEIVLVDSLNKRINFLNDVIEKLELKNIETVHARVEEFARNKKYREGFDIATSRAVANMTTLSEYMVPLLKIGGKAICMKGIDINDEVEDSKKAIRVLGGKVEKIDSFNLPGKDMGRSIVIISKIFTTPVQFPRKAGMPGKEPIQ